MGTTPANRIEDEWLPILLLPNIDLKMAVESKFALLAGLSDPRVQLVAAKIPAFAKFAGQFTDAFGRRVTPSVLLLSKAAPPRFFRIDALASFRDLVTTSVIPFNRSLWLQYRTLPKVAFSNSFSLYPWSLSKDLKNLTLNTSAMLAIDGVDKFRGQSSPELSTNDLQEGDFDSSLLETLTQNWQQAYSKRNPPWKLKALFRSLNMANQAAQIPTSAEVSFYDAGRCIALWVSAFEILVHPGPGQSANRNLVLSLIEQVKWEVESLSRRRYKVRERNGSSTKRVFASSLYARLNWLRNQFLHGNEVKPSMLNLPKDAGQIGDFAPLLYRLALTAFLDLSWNKPSPPRSDTKRFVQYASERCDFTHAQRTIERGLLIACTGWKPAKNH